MIQRVLFLRTGNLARSVLAEATLRAWSGGRFEAFSAGSQPTGRINPFARELLAAEGIPTSGLRSKSWDEFSGDGARTHWGLPDPAAAEGSDDDKRAAFAKAHGVIKARLVALLTLSPDHWSDRDVLRQALARIGFIESTDGEHV